MALPIDTSLDKKRGIILILTLTTAIKKQDKPEPFTKGSGYLIH